FRMIIVALLFVAVLVYCFFINLILGLPPGPPPLPLLGNMLSFQWDLDTVLLGWKARYGRVFTVWLPNPMVVIGDHKLLQEHLVRNGNVYLARRNPAQLLDIWFGGQYGLGFQDNSIVTETRKFALKTLHEVGFGSAALEDSVHNCALEIVTRWRESAGAEVDVTENISKAIGNVVWKVIFGVDLDFDNELVPKFRKLQQDFLPLVGGPLMMALESFPFLRKIDFLFNNHFRRLKAMLDESNAMIEEGIKETEKSFNPDNQAGSYVEAFLKEMRNNEETGNPQGSFHYHQLLASASNLWGAGFDTTVNTLRLCCIELVNHPESQRKLQNEIDEIIGTRVS
ncbi:hypothetical protein PMAYCL1PPCAC_25040, partial [Pristionchus mayeri]